MQPANFTDPGLEDAAEKCYRCKQERGDHDIIAINDLIDHVICPGSLKFAIFEPYPDEDDLRDAAREGRWD